MSNQVKAAIAILALTLVATLAATVQGQGDNLALVDRYQRLHNTERLDETMALFTEDAVFELVGQGALTGDAIRAIHDYDRALDGRLVFINCQSEGDTVTCQAVEFNDWVETAGLQPIVYAKSVFTIDDGKIARISAEMTPRSALALGEALAAFMPWLMENRAEEAAPLFSPEGVFIYSYDNGERVLSLLSEWRETVIE